MRMEPVFFDIETTGIHPTDMEYYGARFDGQILSVGIGYFEDGWRNSEEPNKVITTVTEEHNEYGLLQKVREEMLALVSNLEMWSDFDERKPEDAECFLVGFNSRRFDHQWMGARFSRYRQDPWPFVHERKRLDVSRVIRGKVGHFMKQDDALVEYVGRETDDKFTGKDIPDLYEEGRMGDIESHCRSDLDDLMDLFHALKEDCMDELYDHYSLGNPETEFTPEL